MDEAKELIEHGKNLENFLAWAIALVGIISAVFIYLIVIIVKQHNKVQDTKHKDHQAKHREHEQMLKGLNDHVSEQRETNAIMRMRMEGAEIRIDKLESK